VSAQMVQRGLRAMAFVAVASVPSPLPACPLSGFGTNTPRSTKNRSVCLVEGETARLGVPGLTLKCRFA
jgi:hypothetical protein